MNFLYSTMVYSIIKYTVYLYCFSILKIGFYSLENFLSISSQVICAHTCGVGGGTDGYTSFFSILLSPYDFSFSYEISHDIYFCHNFSGSKMQYFYKISDFTLWIWWEMLDPRILNQQLKNIDASFIYLPNFWMPAKIHT